MRGGDTIHTYIMVYEWYTTDKGLSKLHDKIATYKCQGIANETTWLIVSEKTSQEIYEDFLPLFSDRFFFITEITLEKSAGYLWDQTCDWIKEITTYPHLKKKDIRE